MELYEEKLSSKTLFTGRVFTAKVDTVRLPNDKEVTRELVVHTGGVGILALTEENMIPMVRQYRYGAGKVLLEIPAGKLELGELPQQCGERELKEECGLSAGSVESLGTLIPTGAYCSEVIHLFLARDLVKGEIHLDEDEFLETELVPLAQALEMAADGRISDAKTVVALFRTKALLDRR